MKHNKMASGDLLRMYPYCILILGAIHPITMADSATAATWRVGWASVAREHMDHWNNSIYLLPGAGGLPSNGHVTSWSVFANRTLPLVLQVWRPVKTNIPDVHEYRLVGENDFSFSSPGVQSLPVPAPKVVHFHAGDVIGMYFPQLNPVPFSKGGPNCTHRTLYLHQVSTPERGRVYAFREREAGWNPCRIYSLYADVFLLRDEHGESPPDTTQNKDGSNPIPSTPAEHLDLKLTNGRTGDEGLVLVRPPGGEWGTVCDDNWDDADAAVICRQLGYEEGSAVFPPYFGHSSGPIYLDDVRCNGSELLLTDCRWLWGALGCHHAEDAGVKCYNLNNGSTQVHGSPSVQRLWLDSEHHTAILPNPSQGLPWARGAITGWNFNLRGTSVSDVILQIWRPLGNSRYLLVGRTKYRSLPPGEHRYMLGADEEIPFTAGDLIGFSTTGKYLSIPYSRHVTNCDHSASNGPLFIDTSKEALLVGHHFRFHGNASWFCRMYSLFVTVDTAFRTSTYHFGSQGSHYTLVTDAALSQPDAQAHCRQTLGANLVNVTSQQEYDAINMILNSLALSDAGPMWIGGHVNDPWWIYQNWAHCQPATGKECIVLGDENNPEAAHAHGTHYKMFSRTCHEEHGFICELTLEGLLTMGSDRDVTASDQASAAAAEIIKVMKHTSEVDADRPGTLAGVVVMVILFIGVVMLTGVCLVRRCRVRVGPRDDSESTVRFVSLYEDKPPM